MDEDKPHPYYGVRREVLASAFREDLELARPHFERLLPDVLSTSLIPLVMAEFDHVLVRLPYVGGADGRMSPFFEANAGIIALGRVLRQRGLPFATVSELMRLTYLGRLADVPDDERRKMGQQWMSAESQEYLRAEALRSVERANPGDFVYEYVEAGETQDGERFDFGLDYRECGFCKLCKAGGDEDLLPAICAMDKEVYALRGVELFRSTTIAGGAQRCDFRFRLNPDGREKDERK